jgi:putative peptidoglycan lipid II flippase
MKKTALLIMLITIVSQFFGFARDITLSYFYGASNISDAYLISITVSLVLFSLIGAGISTGYIPMYSKIERDFGVKEGNRYTSNLVNILMVICTVIIFLGLIFTEQIVKVFALGFEGETLALAVKLTRIGLIGIYFTGLIYIFNGFLQIKGNFAVPASIGIPTNLIIILSIFQSSSNIMILAIGSVIATAISFLYLIPFINKKGYHHKLIFDINNSHIKNMAYLALPLIIGISVNQINVLVDRTLASQIVVGGISALHYANKLTLFVQGLFVFSIATAMYPMISKMAAEKDMGGFKKTISEAIVGVNLLVIPTTIGAMIFAEPIVRLLFGRGAFDAQAVSMTSYALFFYAVGMVGLGLREVLSRAFFSMQDTRTPMINAAIAMVMNIILNIILSKHLGIGGLALATSISALFCSVLLFISLRKKVGSFGIKHIISAFIKILIASSVMGVIAKITYNSLLGSINSYLSLIAAILVGAIVYFTIVYFMKIKDADILFNALKRKIKT